MKKRTINIHHQINAVPEEKKQKLQEWKNLDISFYML